MQYQVSLTRLPIPRLQDTIARYLEAQRPLLSDADYQVTKKIAEEFALKAGSAGWKLQEQLIAMDSSNPETNLNRQFRDAAYLKDRNPTVLLSNPYLCLKRDSSGLNQAERAADFAISAVLFRNTLNAGYLEPDVLYSPSSKLLSPWLVERLVKLAPAKYSTQLASLAGVVPLDM